MILCVINFIFWVTQFTFVRNSICFYFKLKFLTAMDSVDLQQTEAVAIETVCPHGFSSACRSMIWTTTCLIRFKFGRATDILNIYLAGTFQSTNEANLWTYLQKTCLLVDYVY